MIVPVFCYPPSAWRLIQSVYDHKFSASVRQLKVRTRIPITLWIYSNIPLEVGFTKAIGLEVILYNFSSRYFINSWPINSDLWSYVISIGQWYLANHVVSTKFAININILLSYYVILNHPVTGFIMVTDFIYFFYSFPLIT